MSFQYGLEQRDKILEQVLAGDTNEWIADLMPEMKGYLERLTPSYLSIFDYYRDFARDKGRPIWGFKMAEWPAHNLVQALRMFPKAKLIYIHRPLADCVRSAKTMEIIQSENDVQQFGHQWLQGVQFLVPQANPAQLLWLDYELLLQSPEEQIARIAAFSGAEGIQLEVMQRRINTFTYYQQEEHQVEGYLPPSSLSAAEEAIIKNCEEQMKALRQQVVQNKM